MAFNFLSKSYTYEPKVTASGNSIGANLPSKAIDYLKDTYMENNDATPQIIIDLNTAKTIDSIWFHSSNVNTWSLAYSVDNTTYTDVLTTQTGNANGFNFNIGFTQQSARYWRLTTDTRITGGQSVFYYEIRLMKSFLALSNAEDLPVNYTRVKTDPLGGSFRLANGKLQAFEGLSEKGKEEITIDFSFLSKANRDILEDIWQGNLGEVDKIKKPVITVFPESVDFPEDIFQCQWSNDFEFNYTVSPRSAGFSGNITLLEV